MVYKRKGVGSLGGASPYKTFCGAGRKRRSVNKAGRAWPEREKKALVSGSSQAWLGGPLPSLLLRYTAENVQVT